MTRPLETAENRSSAFDASFEREKPIDHDALLDKRRKWMVAGAAAILMVGVAIAISMRIRNHASAGTAPGSVDWELSVFSNNKIEFRPSLAIFPPHPLPQKGLRSVS